MRRHQFSRGFKRDVRVAPTLVVDTESLLVRGVIEALAMAAKAGQVISGFSKVEGALGQARGSIAALIHASDGAVDGIRKLDAVARQNTGNNPELREFPVVTALTSEQLDLALGRSNVDTGWRMTTRLPAKRPRIRRYRLCGNARRNKIGTAEWLIRKRLATRH